MLTTQERRQVRTLFAGGPAALLDEGLTIDQIASFMKRDEVAAELRLLDTEFQHRDTLEARTRFLTRRSLGSLAPGAAAVLGRALAGHVYERGPDGNILRDAKGNLIVRDAGPDGTQVGAAKAIMDQLGIADPRLVAIAGGAVEKNLDAIVQEHIADEEKARVVLEDDPNLESKEERALSRERVRTVIERLRPRLAARLEDKSGKPKGARSRRRQK